MMDEFKVIFRYFSLLLECPSTGVRQHADELSVRLAERSPSAYEALAGFLESVRQGPVSRLEEIYTNTFDLQGVCPPYVGQHLFGESNKRKWFMARLNEEYRRRGFATGDELSDHVAVVLCFLAQGYEDEFSHVLQNEGLMPAVTGMLKTFGEMNANPYRHLLQALLVVLQEAGSDSTGDQAGSTEGGSVD